MPVWAPADMRSRTGRPVLVEQRAGERGVHRGAAGRGPRLVPVAVEPDEHAVADDLEHVAAERGRPRR